MSEQHTTTNGSNGASPPNADRNAVARVYVSGTKVNVSFSKVFNEAQVDFDVAGMPLDSDCAKALIAIGAGRAARTGLTDDDPVAAVQAIARSIMAGEWTPPARAPRAHKESEPDEVDLALAKHLDKPLAEIGDWLTNYARTKGFRDRNGNPGVGRAKTLLRQHSAIAPIIAQILAERARATAQAARKQPAEDLLAL